jgi:hypothetical protein
MLNLLKRLLNVNDTTANKIYKKAKYPNLIRVLQSEGDAGLHAYATRVQSLLASRPIRPPIRRPLFLPPEEDPYESQYTTGEEEGEEVIDPMRGPAASSSLPASRPPNLEEALRRGRIQLEPIREEASSIGMTPRTRVVLDKLIPLISSTADKAIKFTKTSVVPVLQAGRKQIAPPIASIIRSQSRETINYLSRHPEVIAGVLYAYAFHDNMPQIEYIVEHYKPEDRFLPTLIHAFKVLGGGGVAGRLSADIISTSLKLREYYKPFIQEVFRRMGETTPTAGRHFEHIFNQPNPFVDPTAHLSGDPLRISPGALLEQLQSQEPMSSASAAAPVYEREEDPMVRAYADDSAEEERDHIKELIEVIAPRMDHILEESGNVFHHLLKPIDGQYRTMGGFDGMAHLKVSSKVAEYLHKNKNVFIGILYAAIFHQDMDEIETAYVKHDMDQPVIPLAFNAYKHFIEDRISKKLKEETKDFCLQYTEKYKDYILDILGAYYPGVDPEVEYYKRLENADKLIAADIKNFHKKQESQPPSVQPVSGMNMAPPGPAPSGAASSSSGTRNIRATRPAAASSSGTRNIRATRPTAPNDPRITEAVPSAAVPGARLRSATRLPEAGDPRVFGPPGGNVGASLKPLVRETKNKLPLPYFDNSNDPYIFKDSTNKLLN